LIDPVTPLVTVKSIINGPPEALVILPDGDTCAAGGGNLDIVSLSTGETVRRVAHRVLTARRGIAAGPITGRVRPWVPAVDHPAQIMALRPSDGVVAVGDDQSAVGPHPGPSAHRHRLNTALTAAARRARGGAGRCP
jgi:hypothetical protein